MPYPDSLRPLIATVLVAIHLPVSLYLILLQGLGPLWRRLGVRSFAILLSAYAVFFVGVVYYHAWWSWHPLPWPRALSWLGAATLLAAVAILAYTYRTIEKWTLHLVRQIAPDDNRRLITDGALGRIRHPRYVAFTLIAVAAVLLTGYPLVMLAFVVTTFLFGVVITLEERELLHYFGDQFRQYRRTVPAFWPRFNRN